MIAVAGDREYAGLPKDGAWTAAVKVGRKVTTLAEGSFGKCYIAAAAHNKEASA